jgi:hypothetical protein
MVREFISAGVPLRRRASGKSFSNKRAGSIRIWRWEKRKSETQKRKRINEV